MEDYFSNPRDMAVVLLTSPEHSMRLALQKSFVDPQCLCPGDGSIHFTSTDIISLNYISYAIMQTKLYETKVIYRE